MSHLVLGLGHQKKGVEVVPGCKGAEWWTGEQLEEKWALSSASNLQGQPRATRLNSDSQTSDGGEVGEGMGHAGVEGRRKAPLECFIWEDKLRRRGEMGQH